MADDDLHAVALLQRFDPHAVFERVGDRFFGVDVLAGFRHFLRDRQMLLVRHGQDDAAQAFVASKVLKSGAAGTPSSCSNAVRLSSERL